MSNANKEYVVKNCSLELKDIDTAGRRVKVVLSKLNVVDSDMEMIVKGAFTKSLLEKGPSSEGNRKIAFLRHHDWEHVLGKWIDLQETEDGLIGLAELGRSTKANDAFFDYQDGLIREHSIGFQKIYDKIDYVNDPVQPYAVLKEINLWEGSAVTFGANSLTPTIDVTKGNHLTQIARINEEMEGVIRALKNGKGTDERLFNLEMKLKVIKQKYNDVFNLFNPAIAASQEVDNVVDASQHLEKVNEDKKQLLINLIQNKCL